MRTSGAAGSNVSILFSLLEGRHRLLNPGRGVPYSNGRYEDNWYVSRYGHLNRRVWKRTDISYNVPDRWGRPVVPWVGNIFRFPLRKLQDYGIAMRFGLVTKEGPFDPVENFNYLPASKEL